MGFEGSGPLANLMLLETDSLLEARHLSFVRWTDDIAVFRSDADQWSELRADLLRVRLQVTPQGEPA